MVILNRKLSNIRSNNFQWNQHDLWIRNALTEIYRRNLFVKRWCIFFKNAMLKCNIEISQSINNIFVIIKDIEINGFWRLSQKKKTSVIKNLKYILEPFFQTSYYFIFLARKVHFFWERNPVKISKYH